MGNKDAKKNVTPVVNTAPEIVADMPPVDETVVVDAPKETKASSKKALTVEIDATPIVIDASLSTLLEFINANAKVADKGVLGAIASHMEEIKRLAQAIV